MADELRLIFIIIGALVLGGLLLHGLWTVRKNAGQPRHRYYDEPAKDEQGKTEGFDELGVGPVRVVKRGGQDVAARTIPVKSDPVGRTEPMTKQPSAEVQTELPFDEPKEPELNFSALADDEVPEAV